MRKLLTTSKSLKVFCVCVFLLFGSVSQGMAGLTGESIFGELGINFGGGPFDPGFVSQAPFGPPVIGGGVEFPGAFGVDVDFDDNSVALLGFNSSHLVIPFNGWRFTLVSPSVLITDVTLASTTVPGFDQSNVFFTSNAIAINAEGSMLGNVFLDITTNDINPVPEPSTMLLLGSGLVGLIGYRMKKARA